MTLPKLEFYPINQLDTLQTNDIDCTLVVFNDLEKLSMLESNKFVGPAMKLTNEFVNVDPSAANREANLIVSPSVVGGRLVISSTGPLLRDYDDVRRFAEATSRAVKRAKLVRNSRKLLLIIQRPPFEMMEKSIQDEFGRYYEVAALAALDELYEQLEARETLPELREKSIETIRIAVFDDNITSEELNRSSQLIQAIDIGRRLAKDIGGPNPERMTAIKATETILSFFSNVDNVNASVIDDLDMMKREYPLLAAVARASEHVPRHAPRIVRLEYRSSDQTQVEEDLYMVGKGINYDTGGVDLKVGGAMCGMSRDKCGAAALAGFMATCSILKPKHVNLSISLAFVRNSIGSNAYVSDEIIKSRAGVRVRIGNTDAEGRMVMSDLLAQFKDNALSLRNASRARLFTCATLTGHVVRTYGPYAAAMDNGPAKLLGVGERLKKSGQEIGDCFEVSTLRRDDFDLVQPLSNCEDVLQANKLPSTMTNRGHQYPAAFLAIASGLAKHGLDAPKEQRLSYTHIDIAGSAEGGFLGKTTGSPIATLTMALLKN